MSAPVSHETSDMCDLPRLVPQSLATGLVQRALKRCDGRWCVFRMVEQLNGASVGDRNVKVEDNDLRKEG